MIQLSMIFSAIAFYYECCKSGRKRVGGNSKSGRLLLIFLTLVMYGFGCFLNKIFETLSL